MALEDLGSTGKLDARPAVVVLVDAAGDRAQTHIHEAVVGAVVMEVAEAVERGCVPTGRAALDLKDLGIFEVRELGEGHLTRYGAEGPLEQASGPFDIRAWMV